MLYSLSEPTKSVVGVKTSPRDEEREKEGEKCEEMQRKMNY